MISISQDKNTFYYIHWVPSESGPLILTFGKETLKANTIEDRRPYQLKIIKSHFNYTSFDKIILPGQGAYASLMSNLKKLKIIQPLKKYLENNSSYLGICVGMQILSDWGYEDKTTRGLGIISGDILSLIHI